MHAHAILQHIYPDSKAPALNLYGRNSYDFQEGTLVFISPRQVIRYVNNSDVQQGNNEGWNLIFHPDLIRRSELGKQIQHYSFFHYDANEALHVSEAEKTSLRQITEEIVSEYSQNLDTHSQRLIVANIQLLLDYCTRYYDRQFYTRSNLNKDIASIFEQTLREYYASGKQHWVCPALIFADKRSISRPTI
ncbi:hypothetical protein [Undibacterium squillarum]|uniref:hypothetical protein n=1 Tax=Undibacterium squillarum TaxID=1131567 RepID=UPI0035B385B0